MVLMPRDSACLFTYWEVEEKTKKWMGQYFQSNWNELDFKLRLYKSEDANVANGKLQHWDMNIQKEDDHFFIFNLVPDQFYYIDFGIDKCTDEKIFTLLRSNVVTLPSNSIRRRKGAPAKAYPSNVLYKQPIWRDYRRNASWFRKFTGYNLTK